MERELYCDDEKEIKDLLMFRKVVKVKDDVLFLDNGTELHILPNEGWGGCGAGWYGITDLNNCDNVITNVEFECESLGNYGEEFSYKIFVYAENKKLKILQVDGDDGNGYYGTGYSIVVKVKE